MSVGSESRERKAESKESAIQGLFLFLKEARQKEEKSGTHTFPTILEELPKDLHHNVHKNFERLKSYGLSQDQLMIEVKKDVENIKAAYEDKRFGIPNGSYLRYEIRHIIDMLVSGVSEEKMDLTKIRGLGVISFDVNGLKTVNDIIGHEAGTEYLKRIVEVLKNGKTTKELEARGIEVFVSSNGGDEFIIVLNDDVNLTEVKDGKTFIDRILEKYEQEVREIDMPDLFDFNTPEIREKFTGIEIPPHFKFMASISGGTAHIEEVLVDDDFSPNAKVGYSHNLNHIINALLEISDRRGKENKNKFKQMLEESGDPQKEFLAVLLKRNIETAIIEAENKRLKELVSKIK